jgi:hypothetical protein
MSSCTRLHWWRAVLPINAWGACSVPSDCTLSGARCLFLLSVVVGALASADLSLCRAGVSGVCECSRGLQRAACGPPPPPRQAAQQKRCWLLRLRSWELGGIFPSAQTDDLCLCSEPLGHPLSAFSTFIRSRDLWAAASSPSQRRRRKENVCACVRACTALHCIRTTTRRGQINAREASRQLVHAVSSVSISYLSLLGGWGGVTPNLQGSNQSIIPTCGVVCWLGLAWSACVCGLWSVGSSHPSHPALGA